MRVAISWWTVAWLMLAALPAMAAGPCGPGEGSASCQGHDPPWRKLEFRARKLFFSATVRVSVRQLASGEALEEMLAAGGIPEGVLPSGALVDRIHVTAVMNTGKTEIADAWIDHETGAVLQSIKEVHGKGNYWKLRRFFPDGYYQIREAPAGKRERKAGRERWTKHVEMMLRWEPGAPAGRTVTSSYALLYLLTMGRFDQRHAGESWLVPVKEHLVEIQLLPGPSRRLKLRLDRLWPGGSDTLAATVDAPTVRVAPRWLDGRSDEPAGTGFMGMRGPVLIAILPGCGIPCRMDGAVHHAGHVTSRLRRLLLP